MKRRLAYRQSLKAIGLKVWDEDHATLICFH
jgi:hypothetical protein